MEKKTEMAQGRGIAPGRAAGKAVVSVRPFMFAHGVDPNTGKVIDVRSDLFGKDVGGKILVFPGGKGSTTGSAWLLETIRRGNAPVGIVQGTCEPILVTAVVMGRLLYGKEIPVVDGLDKGFLSRLVDGDRLDVDGLRGIVTIHPH